MTSPRWTGVLRSTSLLLAAVLVAACSAQPQSQAVASEAASGAPPASGAATAETGSDSPASAAPASAAPSEPAATPAPSVPPSTTVPPKPANVTWKQVATKTVGGKLKVTYRVAWSAPDGVATAFFVYGVRSCLRESAAKEDTPCVVKGMRIPKGSLQLLAEVPGSARTADVTWTVPDIGPGPYYAALVRAVNDAGNSIFTIAWSDKVCRKCTY